MASPLLPQSLGSWEATGPWQLPNDIISVLNDSRGFRGVAGLSSVEPKQGWAAAPALLPSGSCLTRKDHKTI